MESKSKGSYKRPGFDYSLESKMRCCCSLVDGRCDREGVECDECLFNPDDLTASQRREFERYWKEVFEGVKNETKEN